MVSRPRTAGGFSRRDIHGKVITVRDSNHEKRLVYKGTLKDTRSGLQKSDLMVSKSGKIVSKKKHAAGVKAMHAMKTSGLAAKPFTSSDGGHRHRKKHT
jgi:DVNP family